jgi:hypothetical protein
MVLSNFCRKPEIALDVNHVKVVPAVGKLTYDSPLEAFVVPPKQTPVDRVLNTIPRALISAFCGKTSSNGR